MPSDEPLLAHSDQIARLCERYRVKRLELFGSAARGQDDPSRSDYDFLVSFAPDFPEGPFHQYMGLKLDLEDLLGRTVDLVDPSAVRNPFFLPVATAHRRLVYAA